MILMKAKGLPFTSLRRNLPQSKNVGQSKRRVVAMCYRQLPETGGSCWTVVQKTTLNTKY